MKIKIFQTKHMDISWIEKKVNDFLSTDHCVYKDLKVSAYADKMIVVLVYEEY